MLKRILVVSLGLLLSSNVLSAAANHPADLLFQGKPIDSLCFFNLESNSNLIQLKHCGLAKEKYTIKGKNEELIKKGFIGFEWEDKNVSYPSLGFSYYKVFDAGNEQYWIYTINNGGGSGTFTTINLVKRKNADTLEIKNVIDGDRCNGGVQDVTKTNHQLSFSVNLTAFDLFALANANPHQLKAYDDLAACAVCCVAKAFYEIDTNLKPKLKSAELDGTTNEAEMPEQGVYQKCFNKLFASYVSKGEKSLDDAKLKKFVNEFNDSCVKR